jgi:hypothetical protein
LVLKILHVSDDSLPDWRVEKSAISLKNKGNQVYFAGLKPSFTYNRKIFNKIFHLNWNPRTRYQIPHEWFKIKNQINKILDEIRPDIIHAHNILSARLVQEVGKYPFIYDNHEYWSKYLETLLENNSNIFNISSFRNPKVIVKSKLDDVLKKYSIKKWIKWELDIVSKTPTLVPSKSIAVELSKIGNKIFTVPNFPMKSEIEDIQITEKHNDFSSVYASAASYVGSITPYKNIDGFISLFENYDIGILNIIGWKSDYSKNVIYHGFLDRREMFAEMLNNSIGILPFKKHPYHYYMNPNKAYEYAHAGLLILSTNSLKPIFDELKDNVVGFEDYDEMIHQLKYFKTKQEEVFSKRLKTFEFARHYLLWDNYEEYILEAYKLA